MAMFLGNLAIDSPDFEALAPIPAKFSADGSNDIPLIEFSGTPAGTVELALICHDPDAPIPTGFTHWTVYGISADATILDLTAEGLRIGPNAAGQTAWYGPQPPVGHGVHHYYFWIYALSRPVEGTPTREEFIANYSDAIIEQARFIGTFQR